mgnify:FL=1|tara:strand:- start:68 stop:1171 length:1104 start_codon:yes stop_codon:yes gene_type:complete
MPIERKLAAVMFTDIVGFTKIMTASEDTAINILHAQDEIFNPLLKQHNGNLLKKMGDGLLIEFSSAVNAVECALKIQDSIKNHNQADGEEFHIRIGIHLGDVLMLGDDILGDGVNIASRIEPLASPDGICITEAVHQSIKSKLKIDAKRISEVDLKHIDDKYTIYKLPNTAESNQTKASEQEVKDSPRKTIKIINQKYETSLILSFLLGPLKVLSICFFGGALSGYILKSIKLGRLGILDLGDLSLLIQTNLATIMVVLVIIFIFFTAITRRRLNMTFADIRDVENILEMLITTMNYSFVDKKDGYLEYTYTWLEPTFLIKIKMAIPWYRDTESLKIYFDGNNLVAEGLFMHLNKLSKTLKNYTINI